MHQFLASCLHQVSSTCLALCAPIEDKTSDRCDTCGEAFAEIKTNKEMSPGNQAPGTRMDQPTQGSRNLLKAPGSLVVVRAPGPVAPGFQIGVSRASSQETRKRSISDSLHKVKPRWPMPGKPCPYTCPPGLLLRSFIYCGYAVNLLVLYLNYIW